MRRNERTNERIERFAIGAANLIKMAQRQRPSRSLLKMRLNVTSFLEVLLKTIGCNHWMKPSDGKDPRFSGHKLMSFADDRKVKQVELVHYLTSPPYLLLPIANLCKPL